MIDCETGAPLDLLEGRDARPLADWLAAHPGVEIICRDRFGSYADGARTGVPEAVQVADRFHLWQNLAKVVERCVAAHRACLAEPGTPPAAEDEASPPPEPADAGQREPEGSTPTAPGGTTHSSTVCSPKGAASGRSPATWAGGLHTVQRYARAATWQELVDGRWQGPRPSKLDPFKPHLDQHADVSRGSIARLFREIKELAYDGSYPVVRDYLSRHRPARAPLPSAPPTVRDVTGWITCRPDSLAEDERPRLKAILDRCPELQAASGQVRAFAAMLTQLTGQDLPQWIGDAREAGLPGLASFARGLEQDLDAVTLGLTTSWNSGPVEGRVNHIILWNLICQAALRRFASGIWWPIELAPGDSVAVRMGIPGFGPSFLVGIDAIQAVHGSRLAALAGRRLTGFAVVRFAGDGGWFADCPVVLDFDGIQVEVCHWKLDELSIGWDTIDTTAAIAGWEWAKFTPVWSHTDERLGPFTGRELREAALLQWRPSGPDLAAGTVAVEFVFGADRFHIANGLDENHIETGAAQPDYVRHRLSR